MSGSVSRRYARAVMALGTEEGDAPAFAKQLSLFAEAMTSSDELSQTLSNPAFPRADRKRVVTAVAERLALSRPILNTLLLLVDKERIIHTPSIARELQTLVDEQANRVTAIIKTAVPLTEQQASRMRAALQTLSGKEVELQQEIDPSVIGGAIAQLGDHVYDGSLRSQLKELGRQMTN